MVAAVKLRRRTPATGVLILSQFYEPALALELIGDHPEGVGYLLKERVGDVQTFVDAIGRVAAGGTALDPEVVARLLRSPGARQPRPAADSFAWRASRSGRHGRRQVEPRDRPDTARQ